MHFIGNVFKDRMKNAYIIIVFKARMLKTSQNVINETTTNDRKVKKYKIAVYKTYRGHKNYVNMFYLFCL